eukprot:6774372-Prymnesium_polylepis.1
MNKSPTSWSDRRCLNTPSCFGSRRRCTSIYTTNDGNSAAGALHFHVASSALAGCCFGGAAVDAALEKPLSEEESPCQRTARIVPGAGRMINVELMRGAQPMARGCRAQQPDSQVQPLGGMSCRSSPICIHVPYV